jgi:hypothetical protein
LHPAGLEPAFAKVFEYLREKEGERATLLGPRAVGIIMIATGLVALALATVQHRRASKVLHERCPDLPPSLAGVMAAFFALLGTSDIMSRHQSLYHLGQAKCAYLFAHILAKGSSKTNQITTR